MADKILDKIEVRAKEVLSKNDDAHGYEHVVRVNNLAREIWKQEVDNFRGETSLY